MINELWHLGVLSTIIVFGIKIGMAMGFAKLSKTQAFSIILSFGIIITILCEILNPYIDLVYQIVYDYSYILFAIMALIIFYAGFETIKEWKINHQNHAHASCLAMVAPCPCCIGAVVGSIILVSPMVSISSVMLGASSSILLMILITVFYLCSEQLIKWINKPYPVVLGTFMMFVGIYFLLAMIILPNIGTQFENVQMNNIIISNPESLILLVVVFSIIIILGAIYRIRPELLHRRF